MQSRKPLNQSFNGESNSVNVSSMSFSRDDSSKGEYLAGSTGIIYGQISVDMDYFTILQCE